MPKDDVNGGSNDTNKNINKVPISFLPSFSQKIDLNKSIGDASTHNNLNNSKRNVANHPKIDLQRRPI